MKFLVADIRDQNQPCLAPSGEDYGVAVAVPRGDFDTARQNFTNNYTLQNGGKNFSHEFSIKATDFKNITDLYDDNAIPPNNEGVNKVAYKFLHCFNNNTKCWHLCMKAYVIDIPDGVQAGDLPNEDYAINPQNNTGHMLINTSGITTIANPQDTNADYYNNIYYAGNGLQLGNPANENLYTKYNVFPFTEIVQLFTDNGYDFDDPSDLQKLTIKFSSCCMTSASSAGLDWPHGIVIYLCEYGRDLLTRHVVLTNTPLQSTAANYGTMHPPKNSGRYYFPPA